MTFDPNLKLVDLYVNGIWKCKLAYEIAYGSQQDGHKPMWKLSGVRFDYHKNPGPDDVSELQFKKYPQTIDDSVEKIDL